MTDSSEAKNDSEVESVKKAVPILDASNGILEVSKVDENVEMLKEGLAEIAK